MSEAVATQVRRLSGPWRLVLSLVAGAAAALGHAPFGFWGIGVLGFVTLIWCVGGATRPGRIAWAGGAAYFAVALHWIVEPFQVDASVHGWLAPFALIGMAGGLALFWMAAGWLLRLGRGQPALVFAIALSGAEMLRGYVFTGFPWALPAYIWIETPLAQLASIIGPYGLSALTLVVAALVTIGLPRLRGPVAAVVLAGCAAVLGWALTPDVSEGDKIVRLVQPNAPQHQKWDPEFATGFVRRALDFTGEPGDVDLVIWPETTITWPLDAAGSILEAAAARSGGTPVLAGIMRRAEEHRYNSAIMIEMGGAVTETYDKVRLVPFGEYIPFRSNLIRAVAATSGFGTSPGENVRLIDTPLGRALPLICYEGIFPRHGARAGRPDVLIQITNDAWFGSFSGPYQHLDQARFRAIEQGVPLLRAANTGVSAVIDPAGRVVASLPLNEAGFLDHSVPAAMGPTWYSKMGDWPVGVALLAVLAFAFLKRKQKTD